MAKIYVTGDTHRHIDIGKVIRFEIRNPDENDYVIVAGDFGLVWNNDREEIYLRNYLTNNKEFTTLFVEGNHESFFLLNQYSITEWNGGKVHKITDKIIHLMRGEVFTINGKKIFVMGGAESIDKDRRTEGVSWWKEELPSYEEMENGLKNLEKNNWEVDYIITHTCPVSVQAQLIRSTLDNSLEKYLEEIYKKVKFKKWYFGHYHIDLVMDNNFIALYDNITEMK